MGHVHVGRDGWLFLTGGSNQVTRLYRRSPRNWWILRRWRSLLKRRATRFDELGIQYLQVVVPEKLSVISDRCATRVIDASRSPAVVLARTLRRSKLRRHLVDLVEPLTQASAHADMYHKTDTHWTYEGCFVGYVAICRALGVEPMRELIDRPYTEIELDLDLGSKLEPPRSEQIRIHHPAENAVRTSINALVAAFEDGLTTIPSGVGSHATYRNENRGVDRRRVLIFGDSCSNYNPFLLTGLLAETFRDVDFIWSSNIDWTVVTTMKPDIVVCQIVERFINRVPTDDFSLHAFVTHRLEERLGPASGTGSSPASATRSSWTGRVFRRRPCGRSSA